MIQKGQKYILSSSELRGNIQADKPLLTLSEDGDSGRYGTFKAYISVFDSVNSYGFSIKKGAFSKDVELANDKKRQIHINWMHLREEIMGEVTSISEDDHGVVAEGRIALYTQLGREKFEMLRDGIIREYSIEFYLEDYEEKDGELVVTEGHLTGFALVDRGADPSTETLEVGLSTNDLLQEMQLNNQEMATELKEQRKAIEQMEKKLSKPEGEEGTSDEGRLSLKYVKKSKRALDNAHRIENARKLTFK